MTEHDSGSGGGRKGFVRDVMRRIAPTGPRGGEGSDPNLERDMARAERGYRSEVEHLEDAIRFFGSDSAEFKRRLDRVLADFETLRRR